MKKLYKTGVAKFLALFLMLLFLNSQESLATTKIAISGNWGNNSTWIPLGIPGSGNDITIPTGVTVTMDVDISVKKVTINSGGRLVFTPGKKLTILDEFIVNGGVDMNGGNIDMVSGMKFEIGSTGTFIYDPGNNTLAGARVFTNGKTSFNSTSTLIIKKWFDYNVPLTNYMNSDFGNLTLNSVSGSTIYEWNMNNGFKDRQVKGTLTVDQCWLTFASAGVYSKTIVGNIVTTGINSTLYIHSGSFAGKLELEVTNITNNGIFYVLYNGNGDLKLVAENFTNNGNVKLAYNDGVWNVGNNIVEMEVKNSFIQNFGDFRGLYNLSSINAGYYKFKFKNITLNGGLFFGMYAITTSGQTCEFEVSEFMRINFNLPTDKFRGIGLSLLSGSVNNAKFLWKVNKSIIINGHQLAEIISSTSNGLETIEVSVNIEVNGCVISFNYGAAIVAHAVSMQISGKIIVNGGTLNLSRLAGPININLADIDILSGTLNLKNEDGLSIVNMVGNYLQTGGVLNLKSNQLVVATQPINFIIKGNFVMTNGTINYDDNSNGVKHTISVLASTIDFTGGMINGPANSFGTLNYSFQGILKMKRTASSSLQNVKQYIKAGCTVEMLTGNFAIASLSVPTGDNLVIENAGILNIANRQIVSNGVSNNAVVRVEGGGRIRTTHNNGLFNGTMNAAISSNGAMDYWLDPLSTIEYYSMMNQKVSGLIPGANQEHHKYGILEINLGTTFGNMNVSPSANNVFVRNKLILKTGELNLNGFIVTVENGDADAITTDKGYILSETNQGFNPSILEWKNLTLGNHIVPFGKSTSVLIPVTIDVKSGAGKDLSISTRATSISNSPLSQTATTATANSILRNGIDISITDVVDRFWVIEANGITADVTFYYAGIENTLTSALRSGKLSPMVDNNGQWELQAGFRNGSTSSTNYVIGRNISTWGTFVLSSTLSPLPIELLKFTAVPNNSKVNLNWSTATEENNDFFTIEKSKNGIDFTFVAKVKGAGNSSSQLNYTAVDNDPFTGKSYYRLKQTDFDGKFAYSELTAVTIGQTAITQLEIKTVAPNPFRDRIEVRYNVFEAGEVKIQIYSLRGQLMAVEKFSANKGMNESTVMDLEQLSPGTYILNMVYNGISVTHKIIKN